MNAAVLLILSIAILAAGYVFYGGWLAKQWGIDPSRKTPAHELEDGMDYVPGGQPVTSGDLSFSGFATAKCAAFLQQFGSCCPMDGAVDPSAAQKRLVRRVDDRVHAVSRNIALF